MKNRDLKSTFCMLSLIGCVQFCILTIIAMLTFPGGIHGGIDTTGYDFLRNFFSDLGGTVSPTGLPNPISSVLFFIALAGVGIMNMPFLIVLPSIFKENKPSFIFAWIGSIVGFTAAIAFVCIAFMPWDVNIIGHIISVQVAFIGLIPLGACYIISILASKKSVLPKKYAAILIEFTAAAVLYIILLFNGPPISSPEGIMINVVGQKLIVYNSIVAVASLAYGSGRVIVNRAKL
nr:hypothetical protein [Candidatus Sigynarchaeota archaeon]